MDIRKLQRAIVDGLEDVKALDIQVFNTEHLSPLFERVIVASGQSNRQTKALASSVREAVKSRGMSVLRTEGEDNGEWIIVDCGAAVAHIMQPSIREYYRLEEIWGGKPVNVKLGSDKPAGLPKASEPMDGDEPEDLAEVKPVSKPVPAKPARAAKPAVVPAKKAPTKAPAKSPARGGAASAAKPARGASAKPAGTRTSAAGKPASTGARKPATGASSSMKKVVAPVKGARSAAAKKGVVPAKKAASAPKKAAAPAKRGSAPAKKAAPAPKRAAPSSSRAAPAKRAAAPAKKGAPAKKAAPARKPTSKR